MTAAVYAARKKLDTLFISQELGGQPSRASGIENYMGYQFIEGTELMHKFEEQVKQFPLDLQSGPEIQQLLPISGGFTARDNQGETYEARTAIIATGKRSRPLNVPGEDRLQARGVTYCAVCDGPLFAGMSVAVIGGGNAALETVDDMVKIAEHVYVISVTPLTGDRILIDRVRNAANVTFLLEHEVVRIDGGDFVQSITVRDMKNKEEKEYSVGGVLIEIGLVPNSILVKDVVKINRIGEIEVDCGNATSIAGLFAAGDVTNVPAKQIVVAAGEGAKAALAAYHYLQRLEN